MDAFYATVSMTTYATCALGQTRFYATYGEYDFISTYATCALGQFTEEDDDGDHRE